MLADYEERIESAKTKASVSTALAILFLALYSLGMYVISNNRIYAIYRKKIEYVCVIDKDLIVFYSSLDEMQYKSILSVDFSIEAKKKFSKHIVQKKVNDEIL